MYIYIYIHTCIYAFSYVSIYTVYRKKLENWTRTGKSLGAMPALDKNKIDLITQCKFCFFGRGCFLHELLLFFAYVCLSVLYRNTQTHTHTHTHQQTDAHTYTYAHTPTNRHTRARSHMLTCVHAHTHMCTRTRTRIHSPTYAQNYKCMSRVLSFLCSWARILTMQKNHV